MKQILAFCFALASTLALAQAPQGLNYQAIYRDSFGNALLNQTVNVAFSILNGSVNGTAEYSETHTTQTNPFGLFTLTIGQGTPVSGTFSAINWAGGSKFLKVEVNNALVGITQLLSVPYALYAENSKDNSPTNELQTLALSGDTLTLSPNGGSVTLTGGKSQWTNAGPDIFYNTGNVGIGTNAPQERLHVAGKLKIDGEANVSGGIFTKSNVIGLTSASIPLGITQELGGNTPLLNLDVNFRHPNKVSSQQGAAFRIDPRSSTGDQIFQWLYRASNAVADSVIMILDSHGNALLDGSVTATGLTIPPGAGAGKVLTSDNNGKATWQTPAGGNSQWTTTGNDIYYNKGKVLAGDLTTPFLPTPTTMLQLASSTREANLLLAGAGASASNFSSIVFRDQSSKSGWDFSHKTDLNDGIKNHFKIDFYDGATGTYNFSVLKLTPDGKTGLGFGNAETPPSKLSVKGGDINILDIGNGIIMKSPNGNCWRITIDNNGTLIRTAITCP